MNNFFAKNARRFRTTLSICLLLAVSVATVLVVLAVRFADTYSAQVKQTVFDASNSEDRVNDITQLANKMKQNKASVDHVEQIVADSKSYEYQDLIVNDLRSMAEKAKVSITSFDFSPQTANGKPKPKTSGPLHSKMVNVTLANPINYNNFLNFLHYIELNNTKMQVSNVALTTITSGKDAGSINSESLEIEVYVR